ncbi:MAG: Ig-like domain-containing protein [Bacteroidales bacterium]|nr:Ig-like domain-containing protein [Bacteroidales bacterium]
MLIFYAMMIILKYSIPQVITDMYPRITTNPLPEQTGHISNAGALRLAKAMWWMLARIAGWDGGEGSVPVSGITVTGAGGASTITRDNGTLALTATVTPANATNKSVTWSIINGTGQATISSSG